MLTNREEPDQLFRDKLGGFSPDPPQYLWENIESRLNTKSDHSNPLRIVVSAAAVLVLIFAGWWLNPLHRQDPMITGISSVSEKSSSSGNKTHQGDPEQRKIAAAINTLSPENSIVEANPSTRNTFNKLNQFTGRRQGQEVLLKKSTNSFAPDFKSNSGKIFNRDEKVPANRLTSKRWDLPLPGNFRERKSSPWSIEIKASPFFTPGLKALPNHQFSGEQTFSGGLIAGYDLNKRVHLNSGLLINSIQRKSKVSEIPVQERYHYFEIPLTFGYTFIDKKVNVGVMGGVSANILASERKTTEAAQADVPIDAPGITYAGMVGLEIGYQVSKKIRVTLEPFLKQYLTSFSEKSDVNFQSCQAGIYTGVRYSFN